MGTPSWMKSTGRSVGIGMAAARRCLPDWLQRHVLGLPTSWAESTSELCAVRGWEFRQVRSGAPPRAASTETLGEESPEMRTLAERTAGPVPAFVAVIPGGQVLGRTGTCIAPDGTLLLDVSPHLGLRNPAHHRAFTGYAVAPPARRVPGSIAVLAASSAGNYFHWMTDAVPRAGILEAAGFPLADFDAIVVPDSRMEAMSATLGLLGVPQRQLVRMGHFSRIRAEKLVIPSLPGPSGRPPPASIDFLRSRLGPRVGRATGSGTRLFVERASRRVITNHEEVRRVAVRHGFRPIRLEGLAFEDQAGLFSAAEAVVGIHGAALTNLAFCAAGTPVLELFAPSYVNPCYATLCAQAGHPYRYLLGIPERKPKAGRWADLTLDPAALDREIGALMGKR